MANRTRNQQKRSERTVDCRNSAWPTGHTANLRPMAKLSAADIAELAQQMQLPDGMLQMVLDRYPELGKPLARRWALRARGSAV